MAGEKSLWRLFHRQKTAAKCTRHIARYERVLGTSLELQCLGEYREQCRAAEEIVLGEIDRLEAIFSAYRPESELRRWQETFGTPEPVSPELAEVLGAAERWRRETAGAFHPAVEALARLWRIASETGGEPDAFYLRQILQELQQGGPLWEIDTATGTAKRLIRRPVNLNAIAKGFILDRAARAAADQPGIQSVLLNIGGDIRQIGGRGAPVGVTDPFAPHENAGVIATIRLSGQGIATSGGYRRGFEDGTGKWRSHLFDPRTGYPVERVVSATVIADDTMTADALATAFSVLDPYESLQMADRLPGTAVLLVSETGERHMSAGWSRFAG